jgi:hypothetical protein
MERRLAIASCWLPERCVDMVDGHLDGCGSAALASENELRNRNGEEAEGSVAGALRGAEEARRDFVD